MGWFDFGPWAGFPPMDPTMMLPGHPSAPLPEPPYTPMATPDAMIGGVVSPVAPASPVLTQPKAGGSAGGDTDKAKAAVDLSSSGKQAPSLQQVLKGVQAPAPPQGQKITSPNAPMARAMPGNSQLAALLASMGVTPRQVLRLGGR